MQNQAKSTIDPEEIERFAKIAEAWWDPHGKFAPLHKINPLRIGYIKDQIAQHFDASRSGNIKLLDIGCGGGLIAEPMAKAGFDVTGIDAGEKNIRIAQMHAESSGVKIDYRCTTAEAMNGQYDVVLALEIVEHVADVAMFVEAVCKRVKPGGVLIISTLNRTAKSYALAIVGAEYILRWLPKGTHTWQKFLKPHELVREIEKHGIQTTDLRGMVMHPLSQQWRWDAKDLSVNYIVTGTKSN